MKVDFATKNDGRSVVLMLTATIKDKQSTMGASQTAQARIQELNGGPGYTESKENFFRTVRKLQYNVKQVVVIYSRQISHITI